MYFPDQQDFIEESNIINNIFNNYYNNNNMNYYDYDYNTDIMNYYKYNNNEIDNEVYENLLNIQEKYYDFSYNIFMMYIYFAMYVYVFIIIDYLNEKNTINKIGNLSVREYYPLLIGLRQKCYETKYHDKLILYFTSKKLRIYLKNLCNNNYYNNQKVDIKYYYNSVQNMYSEKLFHYGSLNEKKIIRIRSDKLDKTFKISVGELNYLIWTIDTKLFNYAYSSYNDSFFVNYYVNNNPNERNINTFKSYFGVNIYSVLNKCKKFILEKTNELYYGMQLYYEYHEDIFRT